MSITAKALTELMTWDKLEHAAETGELTDKQAIELEKIRKHLLKEDK